MKKLLSGCLLFSIIFNLIIGFYTYAADISIQVGTGSCTAGKSISIPLTIENNTGFSNLGIEIEYDSDVLSLEGVSPGTTGAVFTPAQELTANPYNMSWDSTTNAVFNGTLAILEFSVLSSAEAGSYPIKISYYKGRDLNYTDGVDVNYDENFNPLNLSYVDGYITVSPTISTPVPTILPTLEPVTENGIEIKNLDLGSIIQFTVKLNSVEAVSGQIISALYDDSGKLISVQISDTANFDDYRNEFDFAFGNAEHSKYIKVMWWDNLKSMTPQADSECITIN
ncbi:MAG: hypothetical protein J1G06_03525 [Oscillospiraceae bacterium]|nr:hypothetical protein [Oscillospiraceae bacterium]